VSVGLRADIERVYRALGGAGLEPRVRPGAWDIVVDGIAVELDEELHFNRYRGLTLTSRLYEDLPTAPFDSGLYARLCREREPECLRAGAWGKRWQQDGSDKEFGASGPPGDLEGLGSSRWRQRAFYDLVKDTAPLGTSVPVARLSIWEPLDLDSPLLVDDVLDSPDGEPAGSKLRALVHARAGL
jgi:hypothetical protein